MQLFFARGLLGAALLVFLNLAPNTLLRCDLDVSIVARTSSKRSRRLFSASFIRSDMSHDGTYLCAQAPREPELLLVQLCAGSFHSRVDLSRTLLLAQIDAAPLFHAVQRGAFLALLATVA